MNRRSFFARLAGSYVAASALTLHAPKPTEPPLTFKGQPIVWDNQATHPYWRNQRTTQRAWSDPGMQQAMRDLFNACHRS